MVELLEGEVVRGEHTHVYRPPTTHEFFLKNTGISPLPDEMLIGLASAKEKQKNKTKNIVFSWARATQQATKCMKVQL